MNKLITKSCEEIMTTVYKPIEFAVDGLLAQGLYILAGSPKAGKSWLALQLCLAVAKGEKLLERETSSGTAQSGRSPTRARTSRPTFSLLPYMT